MGNKGTFAMDVSIFGTPKGNTVLCLAEPGDFVVAATQCFFYGSTWELGFRR